VNILAIPVCTEHADVVAWHFDTKGVFSVKSAYHVLEDEMERDRRTQRGENSCSRSDNDAPSIWKRIWELNCQPKVCLFIWRLAHNSLPLKMKIKSRNIDLDTRCPVCCRYDEDGGHCFLKCKYIRHCWNESQLEDFRRGLLNENSARNFVEVF
jgi:hypothetical protein